MSLSNPIFSPSRLLQDITEWSRKVVLQHNALANGNISAVYYSTSAPTTGTHQVGDYVRNGAPAETGTLGSKYIILGWVCVTAGTPGTWKECRVLTGG